MSSKQPLKITKHVALALLLVILLARTVYQYVEVLNLVPIVKARPFAAYFRPGLVEAVNWIREQNPTAVRMASPYERDRYLYERLGEMLYPIPFEPLDPAGLTGADLCVVPTDRPHPELEDAALLFQNDCIRVLRTLP